MTDAMLVFLKTCYPVFGLAGCVVITTAILVTVLVYRGVNGQRYSLLNHYISELGELGVSRRAGWFNTGMIITGLLFIPYTTGLGLALGNHWAGLGILAGLWAGISCLLVGVYPMNNLTPHARVATSYFRGGLVTILMFSLGILFQPSGALVITRRANLAGLLAILSYGSFIVLSARHHDENDGERSVEELAARVRPGFDLIPALEWLVFITTILWLLVISLCS